MSKAIANPKIFAAICLLFAGAAIFNVTATKAPDSNSAGASGMGLRAPERMSAPVLEVVAHGMTTHRQ